MATGSGSALWPTLAVQSGPLVESFKGRGEGAKLEPEGQVVLLRVTATTAAFFPPFQLCQSVFSHQPPSHRAFSCPSLTTARLLGMFIDLMEMFLGFVFCFLNVEIHFAFYILYLAISIFQEPIVLGGYIYIFVTFCKLKCRFTVTIIFRVLVINVNIMVFSNLF